jgi:hypothetical protein
MLTLFGLADHHYFYFHIVLQRNFNGLNDALLQIKLLNAGRNSAYGA